MIPYLQLEPKRPRSRVDNPLTILLQVRSEQKGEGDRKSDRWEGGEHSFDSLRPVTSLVSRRGGGGRDSMAKWAMAQKEQLMEEFAGLSEWRTFAALLAVPYPASHGPGMGFSLGEA